MAPTANSVKPSGDISLSDSITPVSPSKQDSVGYNLRSGLKAILTTPALRHPIPDISLSDATLEGSGLYDYESVQTNKSPLSKVSESVFKNLEQAKKTTERAASPVKNKTEAALDSVRQSAASTADDAKSTAESARRGAVSAVDVAKSTASSALHTVENKTAETFAYAKRKAEESLDYAKHVADDGVKYAKQKTGLGDESVSSKAREGVEEVKYQARKGVADTKAKVANVSQNVQESAKAARPSSPVKSPVVIEHAGVFESLAGSAKNLAEKFSTVVHHPLGGAAPLHTGAPTSTPMASFPSKSPTKSAPSARVTEIPTTSGQKVPFTDEDILLGL